MNKLSSLKTRGNIILTISKQYRIAASLVLYQNNPQIIHQLLSSISNTPLNIKLFVVDNSPTANLSKIFSNVENVTYYHHPFNPGFGASHNFAISKIKNIDYYIVLNPDIYFEPETIPKLIEYLDVNTDIGLLQPKICFPNGSIQYLCKRYPTLLVLLIRRFTPKQIHLLFQGYLDYFEMKDMGYNKITDAIYLSGCFMLFRKKCLDEVGYFDENFFMYFEDADITIRMAKKYRCIFYPDAQIFHYWTRGSYSSWQLATINIYSAFYFFCKHGWKII